MSSAGRRAKTKTFTGCWTCRKRKVKCDETRPVCRQCTSRNVPCAGYAMRLQWLAPETTEACVGAKPPTMYDVAGMSQRRNMVCDEPQAILSECELDELLDQVDIAAPASSGPTESHGPFGVFLGRRILDRFLREPCSSASPDGMGSDDTAHGGGSGPVSPPVETQTSPASCRMAVSSPRSSSRYAVVATETPTMETPAMELLGTGTPATGSPALETPAVGMTPPLTAEEWAGGYQMTVADAAADGVGGMDGVAVAARLPPAMTIRVAIPPPLDPMPQFDTVPEARRLLHHYINHVVDLMTVVATPKGPWKSVHLPRALCGSAETELVGRTTHARSALFHALLTISAYNLAATYSTTGQELPARDWRALALRLKARTLTHLKAGLQGDCPPAQRGKYKEVLAVMLSMITIDVCSGETRTSEWHLRGLESFIQASQQEQHRRHYSGKARTLHRVYVYLRIMRESTDLRVGAHAEEEKEEGEGGGEGEGGAQETDKDHAREADLEQPLFFLDRQPDILPDWLEDVAAPTTTTPTTTPTTPPGGDLSACELVYGLPLSLLVLVGKTSELIRRQRRLARRPRHHPPAGASSSSSSSSSSPSSRLARLCDALENEILEWPVDAIVAGFYRALPISGASRQLVEHQTRAFHQALIVYFSRLVRAVHRRHLQPYVRDIIGHLDAIEVIKHRTNMATGCILWPGFIGASEALDLATQSRYLQWFRATRFYGLGAYEKACEVVLEVWKQQRKKSAAEGGAAGAPCDWVAVVEAKDIRLMLT